MPAITSLSTLKAAAADALVRSDFTDRIADAVPLAEAFLNRSLRLRMMESDEGLVMTPGSAVVALPADYLEALSLTLNETTGSYIIPPIGAGQGQSTNAGRPQAWWIDGANLVLDRPADSAYSLTLHMLKRFALTADGDTNALLTAWPDLYLAAVLTVVCGIYLTDDPRLAVWKSARDEALAEVTRKEVRSKSLARLGVDQSFRQHSRSRLYGTVLNA